MKNAMKLGMASALVAAMCMVSACSSTEEKQDELSSTSDSAMVDGSIAEDNTSTDSISTDYGQDTSGDEMQSNSYDSSSEAATSSDYATELPAKQSSDVNLGASSSGLGH